MTFAVRGFQVDGKTDQAVALMKQIKVYPLDKASSPPPMEFLNGSRQEIDTLFPDNFRFFELLAMLVDEEPLDSFGPLERSHDAGHRHREGQAVRAGRDDEGAPVGGGASRRRDGASQHLRLAGARGLLLPRSQVAGACPGGMTYKFERDGAPQIDARNNVYYMAAGNSPAMMEKNVGQGSQYLWTYRDAAGDYLDGAKNYRLHVLPGVPAKNFWSVVVYDALSRSELQNGQPLPSVSSYSDAHVNADGSVDIVFGPDEPQTKGNWIQTVPGRGGFRSSASTARRAVLRQDLEARGHRRRVVTCAPSSVGGSRIT